MPRTFLEPESLNQMINGMLLMLIGMFFWAWLAEYGIPANILLGIGVATLLVDIRDYSLDPKPQPLLIGGVILPVWPMLRFWIRSA